MVLANFTAAAIRPSFGGGCEWNATDIVVVAQGKNADGVVTVLETWHGQLAKGEQIHVAGLPQAPIRVSTGWEGLFNRESAEEPKWVGGERIILFLKPVEIKPDARIPLLQVIEERSLPPDIKKFRGASFWESGYNSAISSAVWFEQGQAYTFMQMMNPGPSELHPSMMSEENLKKSVQEIQATKNALEKAKSVEQPGDRVAALLPLTQSTFVQASRGAMAALGKCGKVALPALKEMIGNNAYFQGDVIDAIAEASGTDVGQEIKAILEVELAFWKTKGPELEVGWWNGTGYPESWEQLDKLRDRYGILNRGLWILRNHPYPPSRELVTEIRDFWTSLPQLDDKSGLNQISKTCEEILTVLD